MLKLFVAGLTILLIFSTVTYYAEKNQIIYREENGKRIEETTGSSNIRNFGDSVWWAVVTSTTVGYGDYYPVTAAGRIAGILLMFFGISLVGIVTGKIASVLFEKQLKEGRGLKTIKLKNHFIICGWKRDMAQVLKDIMSKNKEFIPQEIVLINTANPDDIEAIKSEPALSGIHYIHGDYIDENILKKANLKHAAKVLLLADRMIMGSVQEVDSRIVMAIITIKTISRTVYTTAEILDKKFERYLISANCDEIILTSEYNRSLIANASAGSGISHVISELLDVNSPVSINTLIPPPEFIGKQYSSLVEYYSAQNNTILIGLLENTGNFHTRKMEAIEEAQKAPDISTLVDNLKIVKSMTANRPIINPPLDYIIGKYSKVIIIEGRGC